ncbi:hypothetical protein KEJ21_06990 [Candidatus Bathyarchaeota archaeon]|nr:hypothetical protein [Candidatus Bathyarchaeota archaeon]MBS7631257.1 hypothetical protein [Candidatus Bathyarchaeota archaeon]
MDLQWAFNNLLETTINLNAKRLVIDSVTAMLVGRSELKKRYLVHLLYKVIQKSGCTTLMIADMPWGNKRIGCGVEEFIADGIS